MLRINTERYDMVVTIGDPWYQFSMNVYDMSTLGHCLSYGK